MRIDLPDEVGAGQRHISRDVRFHWSRGPALLSRALIRRRCRRVRTRARVHVAGACWAGHPKCIIFGARALGPRTGLQATLSNESHEAQRCRFKSAEAVCVVAWRPCAAPLSHTVRALRSLGLSAAGTILGHGAHVVACALGVAPARRAAWLLLRGPISFRQPCAVGLRELERSTETDRLRVLDRPSRQLDQLLHKPRPRRIRSRQNQPNPVRPSSGHIVGRACRPLPLRIADVSAGCWRVPRPARVTGVDCPRVLNEGCARHLVAHRHQYLGTVASELPRANLVVKHSSRT